MIQNLILACVERRFQTTSAPKKVEWLTNNGSCFTAKQAMESAEWLRRLCCLTSVRSPERNEMTESFVKTFKRDYVFCHDRSDALTVLSKLEIWFRVQRGCSPQES